MKRMILVNLEFDFEQNDHIVLLSQLYAGSVIGGAPEDARNLSYRIYCDLCRSLINQGLLTTDDMVEIEEVIDKMFNVSKGQ